ncbi:MAG: hypothetical protein RBT61_11500, partial [Candidatus Kapabacteria bacterium]|nr:hypothetical protein [Candidatus Kapabacteria bacterium]
SDLKNAEWLSGDFIQLVKLKIFGESYGKILSLAVDIADNSKIKIVDAKKVNKGNTEGLYIEIEIKEIQQLNAFEAKIKSSKFIDTVKYV